MSNFSERRKINYSSSDLHCRYLNVDLPCLPRSQTNTGRFGNELKKLGIHNFPYGIHPSDFIFLKILKPTLYVNLPTEFFENWENFPECPLRGDIEAHSSVGLYQFELIPTASGALSDLIHPYDGLLKDTFATKYQEDVPEIPTIEQHKNGAKYISAEGYLPYWHTYALADSFYIYRYAKHLFSSDEDGKKRVIDLIRSKTERFCGRYAAAFDRISWYKTIVTGSQLGNLSCTQGDLFSLAQNHSKVTIDVLKQDLCLVLELDAVWVEQIKLHGCTVLKNARNGLGKDIYLIYEQLRLLGESAKSIFDEFQPGCMGLPSTALYEVLGFEHFIFQNSFINFGKIYCTKIASWGYECSESTFDFLIEIRGFDAWIRAFHDLHQSLNTENLQPVSFKQDRIVDALIVMSVRTEIVLREMFRSVIQEKSDETIVDFLKTIKEQLQDKERKILETCCNEINTKTKLNDRPNDIFLEINNFHPKNWSKMEIYFLQAILRFIKARNYFAHHAYKDDALNNRLSALALEILQSLLATLLFFQRASVNLSTAECGQNISPMG